MKRTRNVVCKLIGHSWAYKNYEGWMKPDGSTYSYKRARKCTRCNEKEITVSDTEIEWRVFNSEI